MVNQKITELTELTIPAGVDVLAIVDDPSGTPVTKKITFANIEANLNIEGLGTSLTAGSVLFSNGTNITEDNTNFFWDETLERLGIGTNTPAATFDLNPKEGNTLTLRIKGPSSNNMIELINHNSNTIRTFFDRTGDPFFTKLNFKGPTTSGVLEIPFIEVTTGVVKGKIDHHRFWTSGDLGLAFWSATGLGAATVAGYFDHKGKFAITDTYTDAVFINGLPSRLFVKSLLTTDIVSIFKALASQTANLTEWRDSSDNVLSAIGPDGEFNYGSDIELTIATGVIIATKSYHSVDTESDTASDDLNTINGGTEGDILIIRANNSSRTIVVKDAVGNLALAGDFTMDNAEDTLTLIYDGSNWLETSRSNNGL